MESKTKWAPGIYGSVNKFWVLRSSNTHILAVLISKEPKQDESGMFTMIESVDGQVWWPSATPLVLDTPQELVPPIAFVNKNIAESFLQEDRFKDKLRIILNIMIDEKMKGEP